MTKPPCVQCDKNGCGAYHDVCPLYQAYVDQRKKARESLRDKTLTTAKRVRTKPKLFNKE